MSRISEITGFPLDSFQKKAYTIIEKGDDLLTTLPTGSGKTVVALTAVILNAFDKGLNAILTTPIKALSNQKYAEFQKWLTTAGFPDRVSLLTGDIQARCVKDGRPELLIMTSEILANKLDRETADPDLINVSVLVIDEMHYINDPERGHVWERTIMNLPQNIQIVALSATLSEPERFQEWLAKRRPTQLVQRKDRHVPLHFGFYAGDTFIELYSTKNENKILDSAIYKKLQPQKGTFAQSINKIVKLIEKEQKLPAIVFLMSKVKCEEAARSLSQNLLYGPRPVFGKDDDPLAFQEIESEHSYNVKCIRNRQDKLYGRYILPYEHILSVIPGFDEFKKMLDKGIGYHHSGLLPILREYVEILFSEKLLKVVFATETLAIGINMPTKCVVFTSLEKPSRAEEMVPLKPVQFMQMAGRSGRRGIDEKGYVVYFPIKSVITESEFRQLLFGKMPSATSQLTIDPLFVLKNYTKEGVLHKSLLFHQQDRYCCTLLTKLQSFPPDEDVREKVLTYLEIQERLKPSMFRLSQSEKKALEKELSSLTAEIDKTVLSRVMEKITIEKEIKKVQSELTQSWENAVEWLKENAFLENDNNLTIRGKVTLGLSDGCPLIRGQMIADGVLNDCTFEEIVGWLGFFTESARISNIENIQNIQNIENIKKIDLLFEKIGNNECQYEMGLVLYAWAFHKNISEICKYIGFSNLGTFVRAVLRVISYIQEMKEMLLGIQYYELYNRLENHQSKLLDGIVTNQSLYFL